MTSGGRRRLAVWLAAIVPLVLLIGVAAYVTVVVPRCVSCHDETPFAEATQASAHTSVACSECHGPSTAAGNVAYLARHATYPLPLVDGSGRDGSAVADSRCLTCHGEITKDVVASGAIRIAHATCAEGRTCTDCHSTTAHGEATSWPRVYDMETCLPCHAAEASTACDLCHAGRRPATRVTSGVFAVTHGANWQKTHGMGDSATCSVCHTAAQCEKCHGVGLPHDAKFLEKHADLARSSDAKCTTCHEQRFCSDCHGLQMPHPDDFARQHATPARENKALCSRCHINEDCTTCHEKHVHPGGAIGALTSSAASQGGER